MLRILVLMLLAAPTQLLAQRVALYAEEGDRQVALGRLSESLQAGIQDWN